MPTPSLPPPARHLDEAMTALHKALRERTPTGGSTHIHDPADLYATFGHLVAALDRVPTVADLLLDHMRAWRQCNTLLLTPLAPGDHTLDEGLEMMHLALSSASKAQEHTSRALVMLMTVLSHYAPNVTERGPDEPARTMEDAHTTRDAIRHLQTRVARDDVDPFAGDYVSKSWLYLMIQVMASALQEGRRADAVKTLTDPSISDGTWRPKVLNLLVQMAELIADVQENGREHLG